MSQGERIRTEAFDPSGPITLQPTDARLEDYLDHVCAPLVGVVPYPVRQELRIEMRAHLEALAASYEERGSAPEAAAIRALRQFGDPRRVAVQWVREYTRLSAETWVQPIWRGLLTALACFGVATLLGLALMWIDRTSSHSVPTALVWLPTLYLLPLLAGLMTGLLAPARHALGTFFALAMILPVLVVSYVAQSPSLEPFTSAWNNLELAWVQMFIWFPLGCGAAALGGSLRARRAQKPRQWVLQQ